MAIITSVHLAGYLMGHAIYTIEKVNCLSFDSIKACQKLNKVRASTHTHSIMNTDFICIQILEDNDEDDPIETIKRSSSAIQLTRSNSFLTRIKKTFANNNKNSLSINTMTDEPETFNRIPLSPSISTPVSPTSSRSSFEQNDIDEQDALEQRLVKQITELFSNSMFLFSNTWGKNKKVIYTSLYSFFCIRCHAQFSTLL